MNIENLENYKKKMKNKIVPMINYASLIIKINE